MYNFVFNNIIGNSFAKNFVSSMIYKNRLSHTLLITGDKGLGKLTFAKEIAKQIINNKAERKMENFVDINITDGDFAGSILINDIRDIKSSANITPLESENKVQIIANCDKMTVAAQNGILKSLEEPSPSVTFILTANNINKLLDTIISRATVINMQKISYDEMVKTLSFLYPKIKISIIIRYAKLFDGNLGLAKSILDSSEKESMLSLCEDFLFFILTKNEYETLKILYQFKNDKATFLDFIELFKIYFEKILKSYLINDDISYLIKNHDSKYFISFEKLIYISDILFEALGYLSANVNLNLITSWLNINIFNHF